MLVCSVMPLVPTEHHPSNPEFTPDGRGRSLYQLLHVPASRAALPAPDEGRRVITLPCGTVALLEVREDSEHPLDALILALGDLRDGILAGADVADSRPLSLPGQAHATSLAEKGEGPVEGMVMIVCEPEDWKRKRVGSLLGCDILPSLRGLYDDAEANLLAGKGGSYVTSDRRGLVVDVASYESHTNEDSGIAETWPSFLELASDHARRTYEVSSAAALTDGLRPSDRSAADADVAGRLQELRQVQMRLAARRVEALLEHRHWQPSAGDDAFGVRQRLRELSAEADESLSDAFSRFQPVIEAAAAADQAQRDARSTAERERLAKERDAEKEHRRRLSGVAAALVSGATVIALFATLAAIPRGGTTFDPHLRAAFATLVLGAAVGAVAWLLQRAYLLNVEGSRRRRVLSIVGGTLLFGAVGTAAVGWLGPELPVAAFGAVLALLIAGACLVLAGRAPASEQTP